jgi:hypothetical protein
MVQKLPSPSSHYPIRNQVVSVRTKSSSLCSCSKPPLTVDNRQTRDLFPQDGSHYGKPRAKSASASRYGSGTFQETRNLARNLVREELGKQARSPMNRISLLDELAFPETWEAGWIP